MLKISVIIPTYNRAKYLPRSLASLANQTLPKNDFEVIVVNDGSRDKTEEVAKKFQEELNLNSLKQNHGGASRARNQGIKSAQSEILVFFDDDAIADNDWLKNIAKIMEHEKIITGRVEPINNNIWQFFAPHYNQSDFPHESPNILEGNCALHKSVFDDLGLFDENLDYGHEGEEFRLRALKKYQIMYYPEMLIYHDYSSGLFNYFKKQKKFGEKMVYIHKNEIKNFAFLLKNYQKIKTGNPKGKTNYRTENPILLQKFLIKIIARIGNLFHLYGVIKYYLGQTWCKNQKNNANKL